MVSPPFLRVGFSSKDKHHKLRVVPNKDLLQLARFVRVEAKDSVAEGKVALSRRWPLEIFSFFNGIPQALQCNP